MMIVHFFFSFIFQISTGFSSAKDFDKEIKKIMINISYLIILKFSLEIIFSISFFGDGKSILFNKKTTPKLKIIK